MSFMRASVNVQPQEALLRNQSMSQVICESLSSRPDLMSRASSSCLIMPSFAMDGDTSECCVAYPRLTPEEETKDAGDTPPIGAVERSPLLLACMSSIANQYLVSLSKPYVQAQLKVAVDTVSVSPDIQSRLDAITNAVLRIVPCAAVSSSLAVTASLIALHCLISPSSTASTATSQLFHSSMSGSGESSYSFKNDPPLTPSDLHLSESHQCISCTVLQQHYNRLASNLFILEDGLANLQAECGCVQDTGLMSGDKLTAKARQEMDVTYKLRDALAEIERLKGRRRLLKKRQRSTRAIKVDNMADE